MLDRSRNQRAPRQSSYVQVESVKSTVVKQFTFSNHSLAIRVRQKMMNLLTQFDANKDLTFDQQEITNALVALLMESKSQIKYVLKNVFRYDVNNDGQVSYDQLTNFCVQQHFGEIAIQRLHRDELYSRGKERVMNQQQFKKTMKYCLSFISIEPEESLLSTLFNEIDLNKEKWIKYSVYFNFLKEYFGSKSYASDIVKIDDHGVVQFKFSDLSKKQNPDFKSLQDQLKPTANKTKLGDGLTYSAQINTSAQNTNLQNSLKNPTNKRTKSQRQYKNNLAYSLTFNTGQSNQPSQKFGTQTGENYKSIFRSRAFSINLEANYNKGVQFYALRELQHKMASLIYTQLKVIVMKYDDLHDLYLRKKFIQQIIKNQFNFTLQESQQFVGKILNNEQNVSYECFMQEVLPFTFCQVYLARNPLVREFRIENFAAHFISIINFLKVKPSKKDLQLLFLNNDFDNDGKMSINDYKDMIYGLFRAYYFRKYRTIADLLH